MHATPEPASPLQKSAADNKPPRDGPCRSMNRPRNAAEIPKKNIARLKAPLVSLGAQPNMFSNGMIHALYAYIEPIEMCTPTAEAAINQRFLVIFRISV
jgi:hypothetical protein